MIAYSIGYNHAKWTYQDIALDQQAKYYDLLHEWRKK